MKHVEFQGVTFVVNDDEPIDDFVLNMPRWAPDKVPVQGSSIPQVSTHPGNLRTQCSRWSCPHCSSFLNVAPPQHIPMHGCSSAYSCGLTPNARQMAQHGDLVCPDSCTEHPEVTRPC